MAVGGYTKWQILAMNYRVAAEQVGSTTNKVSGDGIIEFPNSRGKDSHSTPITCSYCSASQLGISFRAREDASVCPLVLPCLLSLIVDVLPYNPCRVAAPGNLTHCTMSAGGIAALRLLLDRIWR